VLDDCLVVCRHAPNLVRGLTLHHGVKVPRSACPVRKTGISVSTACPPCIRIVPGRTLLLWIAATFSVF
jgi:hypothetical protein